MRRTPEQLPPTGDVLMATEALAHFKRMGEPVSVLATPWPNVNEVCKDEGAGEGFAAGWYIVIGGDTGHGKSLLGLQLMQQAVMQKHRVGVLSLEMSGAQVRSRLYSMLTGVPVWQLEPGKWYNEKAAAEVVTWIDELKAVAGYQPLWINNDPISLLGDALIRMEEWRRDGCTVFLVDYLQLLESPGEVGAVSEIKKISKALRDFAHYNGVLVIALSQYNNESGNDNSRKPHNGSFYGGRRIPQDSDMAIAIDHSRHVTVPDESDVRKTLARSWLIMTKNRHGPRREIPVEWEFQTLMCREMLHDEEAQWATAPEKGGYR